MSDWRPMSEAPTDGTVIQAEIPGHGADNMICWQWGQMDAEMNECGGWCFAHEDQEPPDCWTDGWCWAENEDGVPSVKPTRWKPAMEAA